jgi:peptidoglycan hydrolase CwlO-like protein
MTTVIVSVVGLCISATAIGVTIYNAKKKETKEDTGTMTTLVVGVETIKDGVSEIKRDLKDTREEMKSFDRRLTRVETLIEDKTV